MHAINYYFAFNWFEETSTKSILKTASKSSWILFLEKDLLRIFGQTAPEMISIV